MSDPEIRAEPEVRCGVCETIGTADVLEGLGQRHWESYTCPTCGTGYDITLEVEEAE